MKQMKRICSLGLLIVSSGVCMPVSAETDGYPARGPMDFSTYDQDKNGFISEQEFNTVRKNRMAAKSAHGMPMRGADSAPTFAEFDGNADGQLSSEELDSGQQMQREKRRAMGMNKGQGMNMKSGQGRGMNMPSFADHDLNGDGKIMEDEFNNAKHHRMSDKAQKGYMMKNKKHAPSFKDIDTDNNGEIDADELAAHQAQYREQKRP
jgi:Ca2+-binding EF-hand superfamily protein